MPTITNRKRIFIGGLIALAFLAGCVVIKMQDNSDHLVPVVQEDDPYDTDPDLRKRTQEQVQAQPVIQELPVIGPRFQADLVGKTPDDGKLVIQVRYTGSRQRALRRWQLLLKRTGDDGKDYRVIFAKQ